MASPEPIDLRSDTVTRPDAAMRRAMAEAEVGDDVYGEDPTVRRLEEESAAALGFPAALFVPSGTMGNQIALRLLAPRGSELLCDERSHVVLFESGATSVLWGIQPRPLSSDDGLPALDALRAACDPRGAWRIPTGAIALDLSWPAGAAAALPMLTAKPVEGRRFLRLVFSLAELDETYREGAPLYDFRLAARARRVG